MEYYIRFRIVGMLVPYQVGVGISTVKFSNQPRAARVPIVRQVAEGAYSHVE